jgi:hypothetical protein
MGTRLFKGDKPVLSQSEVVSHFHTKCYQSEWGGDVQGSRGIASSHGYFALWLEVIVLRKEF